MFKESLLLQSLVIKETAGKMGLIATGWKIQENGLL